MDHCYNFILITIEFFNVLQLLFSQIRVHSVIYTAENVLTPEVIILMTLVKLSWDLGGFFCIDV